MTAVDRRVLILQELETLLPSLNIEISTGVIPSANFVRNRNELPAERVPGIILIDGDEMGDPATARVPSGRSTPVSARLMRMQPEIYAVLDVRKPQNKLVGEDLAIIRQAIIRAVVEDRTLLAICGSNGRIDYDGVVTDLSRNRKMEGQMGVAFTFVYPFIPLEVAG